MTCVYCFGNKVKKKEKMVGGVCNGTCNSKKNCHTCFKHIVLHLIFVALCGEE